MTHLFVFFREVDDQETDDAEEERVEHGEVVCEELEHVEKLQIVVRGDRGAKGRQDAGGRKTEHQIVENEEKQVLEDLKLELLVLSG